ncbi:hypothetical protein M0812_27024 [Anaeramoeba flamelloides]|uniref:Uncharacterized protein n=1 Tax=Anaeramoeba flamelloides TaxID=1746091 RepID=A0AAV7YC81_9EUKA|nr:hypothetical protein M0812_27024 [Anaeramoeba flamelloides]
MIHKLTNKQLFEQDTNPSLMKIISTKDFISRCRMENRQIREHKDTFKKIKGLISLKNNEIHTTISKSEDLFKGLLKLDTKTITGPTSEKYQKCGFLWLEFIIYQFEKTWDESSKLFTLSDKTIINNLLENIDKLYIRDFLIFILLPKTNFNWVTKIQKEFCKTDLTKVLLNCISERQREKLGIKFINSSKIVLSILEKPQELNDSPLISKFQTKLISVLSDPGKSKKFKILHALKKTNNFQQDITILKIIVNILQHCELLDENVIEVDYLLEIIEKLNTKPCGQYSNNNKKKSVYSDQYIYNYYILSLVCRLIEISKNLTKKKFLQIVNDTFNKYHDNTKIMILIRNFLKRIYNDKNKNKMNNFKQISTDDFKKMLLKIKKNNKELKDIFYLGIRLEKNTDLEYNFKKVEKSLETLNRLFQQNKLNNGVKITSFKALILSQLYYGLEIFDLTRNDFERIDRFINKSVTNFLQINIHSPRLIYKTEAKIDLDRLKVYRRKYKLIEKLDFLNLKKLKTILNFRTLENENINWHIKGLKLLDLELKVFRLTELENSTSWKVQQYLKIIKQQNCNFKQSCRQVP